MFSREREREDVLCCCRVVFSVVVLADRCPGLGFSGVRDWKGYTWRSCSMSCCFLCEKNGFCKVESRKTYAVMRGVYYTAVSVLKVFFLFLRKRKKPELEKKPHPYWEDVALTLSAAPQEPKEALWHWKKKYFCIALKVWYLVVFRDLKKMFYRNLSIVLVE